MRGLWVARECGHLTSLAYDQVNYDLTDLCGKCGNVGGLAADRQRVVWHDQTIFSSVASRTDVLFGHGVVAEPMARGQRADPKHNRKKR